MIDYIRNYLIINYNKYSINQNDCPRIITTLCLTTKIARLCKCEWNGLFWTENDIYNNKQYHDIIDNINYDNLCWDKRTQIYFNIIAKKYEQTNDWRKTQEIYKNKANTNIVQQSKYYLNWDRSNYHNLKDSLAPALDDDIYNIINNFIKNKPRLINDLENLMKDKSYRYQESKLNKKKNIAKGTIENKIKSNIENDNVIENNENYNADWLNKTGIYGIVLNDEIVYVGMTVKNFKSRFNHHIKCIKSLPSISDHCYPLYAVLHEYWLKGHDIKLIPLVIVEDLPIRGRRNPIHEGNIKDMELALITYLKPRYNGEGVKKPYNYYGKI